MAVPVAAIAKKAGEILIGSRKGRRFLGYTIGIAVFLLILPILIVLGLFGWMSDENNLAINQSALVAAMPDSQQEVWSHANDVLQNIADAFTQKGLAGDITLAQTIYMLKLSGKETGDADFCDKLVQCFTGAKGHQEAYTRIESTFGVAFSSQDIAELGQLYPDFAQSASFASS